MTSKAVPVTHHLQWQALEPASAESGQADVNLDPDELVRVTPEMADWDYCGLRVVRLHPGVARTVATGNSEVLVLPLAGRLMVEVAAADTPDAAENSFQLQGRDSVFTRITDFAYAGRDSVLVLISDEGAEVALPSAVCTTRRAAVYVTAEQVPVEIRGAGSATRQVTSFGVPGVFDHPERLITCELITPPGNWSSYPPHKHDATADCPVANEEIYLYRIAGQDQVTPSRNGFGVHRTYTGPEHADAGLADIDDRFEVRDLDVVLVPHGYHGPCVAAPGYPMYYLNVMAGSGTRALLFCDDPDHAWIRDSWGDDTTDPRCPVTSAIGRRDERAVR